jgi:outer membrane receptor protein involved in Fe transport
MWTARGGLAAGDYVVFDTVLSYPFEVFGYKMTGTLNVGNLTDKEYLEGNYNLAEPRAYRLHAGHEVLSFA